MGPDLLGYGMHLVPVDLSAVHSYRLDLRMMLSGCSWVAWIEVVSVGLHSMTLRFRESGGGHVRSSRLDGCQDGSERLAAYACEFQ